MSKLLLLDGNSLTYRAFFALPADMSTASGQVTNAVFGFTSMLINLLRDNQPDGVVVAFDRPEPTFRHEAITEYKANREAAPDILRQQMGLVREVIESLGIAILEAPGFEADDILATLAERGKARGDDVIIVTGDRDTYQLVDDPYVKVLYNRRGVSDYALYDEAGIVERTGVTPAQYPEYAALRGDPSDNLPGVPGVGEKTAAKLITTYGGLDGIFSHLDDLSPKLRASLAEHEARVRQNADVMILLRDIPVEVDLDGLAVGTEGHRRGEAGVRLPRVPLAVRAPARRCWPRPSSPRGWAAARCSRPRSAAASRRRSRRGCWPRPRCSTSPPRGPGPRAAPPSSAWPSCSTPRPPTWRGCRPSTSTTAPCDRPSATTGRCAPTTPSPSCAPCSTAASTSAPSGWTRPSPPTSSIRPRTATRSGELLERYTPHSMADRRCDRRASSTSVARRSTTPSAPPAPPWP